MADRHADAERNKKNLENKELKRLNVGGKFGSGAFFLLFLFHYLFLTSGFHTAFPVRRLFFLHGF